MQKFAFYMKHSTLLCLLFSLVACSKNVQSQRPQMPTPDRNEEANMNIDRSRRTAITRTVESIAPAVVSVNVTAIQEVRNNFFGDPFFDMFFNNRPQRQQVKSLGSGFIISADGYIVTNDHVAGNATEITVAFSDGKKLPAKLIGSDRVTDIALLKIDPPRDLKFLKLANSDQLIVGEWVIALGNPFGLFEATEPTVTVGVVSGKNRNLQSQEGRSYRNMIQTDAAINQGNSGGPLVNAIGEVVGMNTVIFTPGGGSVGLGFAVPINKVKEIVDALKENGEVKRDFYTGLYVLDANPNALLQLGIEAEGAVVVEQVDRNSPAATAGFRKNDILLAINGQSIFNREMASATLAYYHSGEIVKVKYWRNGEIKESDLEIGRK